MLQNDLQSQSPAGSHPPSIRRAFLSLYSSWKTLLINALFFGVYYLFFYETITRSNAGLFFLVIPYYLFVLLVLASSLLATVALSYLWGSRKARSLTGVAQSPIGVAIGAIAASCSCSIPLLGPALYFIGLNSLEVSGAISFFASYQQEIIGAIVVLDLVSVYYYLRLISRSPYTRPVR